MTTDTTKPGKRYPLLLYTRLLGMYRWPAFGLAVLLFGIWWFAPSGKIAVAEPPGDRMALLGAVVSGAFFLFTLFGRSAAYFQCLPGHIRVQTAVLRLKISYSRVREARPVSFSQLFPPSRQRWSQRRFLQPFFGRTGVGLTLSTFPMEEKLLRLFLSPYMFLPDRTGFLLLAKDWMDLSAQIGTYRDAWFNRRRAARQAAAASPRPSVG